MTAPRYILYAIFATLLAMVALAAIRSTDFIEPLTYALTTEVGALAMTLQKGDTQ